LAGERCGAEGSRQRNRREQGVQVQLHVRETPVLAQKLQPLKWKMHSNVNRKAVRRRRSV
jgi:hypothetical protein